MVTSFSLKPLETHSLAPDMSYRAAGSASAGSWSVGPGVGHSSLVICHLSFVICHLPSVICH
jgi:hypothetical protein